MHHPIIEWKDKTPISEEFGDIYFSTEGGPEETQHVFLASNSLPDRWIDRQSFTIFEFGFGFGLNFIETWNLFEKTSHGILYYYAVEKYPVSKKDLEKMVSLFPDLAPRLTLLLSFYPQMIPGYHRIHLTDRICLTLLLGDVKDTIREFYGKVDAWYLDGFAPSKNPDMWSDEVFHFIREHSVLSSTFATYSAAGFVRKSLERNGFQVLKTIGFGKKKEMLRGNFRGENTKNLSQNQEIFLKFQEQEEELELLGAHSIEKNISPWFEYPENPNDYNKTVAIIGAGLAGTAIAEALGRRGVKVVLIDKNGIATGASGNLAGIYYPFLSASFTWYGRFSLESFGYLSRHMKRKGLSSAISGVCTLLNRENKIKMEKAVSVFDLGNDTAAIQMGKECCQSIKLGNVIEFVDGGIARPKELCNANLKNVKNFEWIEDEVNEIKFNDNNWEMYNKENILLAHVDMVVIATAYETNQFPYCSFIPMNQVRGQICYVKEDEKTTFLKEVICDDGYILPAIDGVHVIGATYSENTKKIALDESESMELVEKANLNLGCQFFKKENILGGRVSFRAQTKDRFPVIGQLPDVNWYYENYKSFPYLKDKSKLPLGKFIKNLFISVGHGSRGLLNAHLGAESLAAIMFGEPYPVEKSVLHELHPARFIMRNLKRQIFDPV